MNYNSSNTNNKQTDKISYKRVNWESFTNNLKHTTRHPSEDVNQRIKELSSLILNELKNYQVTINTNKKRCVPWWSSTLTSLFKEKKQWSKKFQKHPTSQNREKYNAVKRKFRNEILEQKKRCWEEFIDNTNNTTSAKDFWNQIKRFNGNSLYTQNTLALKINNTIEEDQTIIANTFAQNFTTPLTPITEQKRRHLLKTIDKQNITESHTVFEINKRITPLEFANAIKHTKNTSAPGLDSINYQTIKNLPDEFKTEILEIYNLILFNGDYPSNWKTALVIPILKKQKSPLSTNSYRPISLLSCLSKLLDKIITKRLQYWLSKENIISRNQFGFQPRLSTGDALMNFSLDTVEMVNSKKHVDCIAIDLTKAFDNCWPETIITELQKYGLTGNIFKLISSYLTDRKIIVKLPNSQSTLTTMKCGVPQGSPLSSILFKIAINGLSGVLDKIPNINYSLFADDITLYCGYKKGKITTSKKPLIKQIHGANNTASKFHLKNPNISIYVGYTGAQQKDTTLTK